MDEQKRIGGTMLNLVEPFGQRGVHTFVLQTVVDIQHTISQTYLDDLSNGAHRLELSLDTWDHISRRAYIFVEQIVSTRRDQSPHCLEVSGGNVHLLWLLGFPELVAQRGKLWPTMRVLDEPLMNLDHYVCTKVGHVIRRMLRPPDDAGVTGCGGLQGIPTILLILQYLAS